MTEKLRSISDVVFDVEHGATHDGPGIRTVVFLKGCPLRCRWCHNPESWRFESEPFPDADGTPRVCGSRRTAGDVLDEVLRDLPFYENSGGGVTLSGGEPLAHHEFAVAFLRLAKEAGLHTAIETSGFAASDVFERFLPFVDLWLFDIKHLDPSRFQMLTAQPLEPVLANLRRLETSGKRVILRLPMIPGLNDDAEELTAIGRLADDLSAVVRLDVEPCDAFGMDKAQRLGIPFDPLPRPAPNYGADIVRQLKLCTRKSVSPASSEGTHEDGAV